MKPAIRAMLLVVIASASVDAEAKSAERCILMLEARPTPLESARVDSRIDPITSRPRCPLAVVYAIRDPSARAVPGHTARGAMEPEAKLDDPSDATLESVVPQRPLLHV
jgi:hypothetical protein